MLDIFTSTEKTVSYLLLHMVLKKNDDGYGNFVFIDAKTTFYFSMCFWLLCMIGIWIGERSVVVQSKKARMGFIAYITIFIESTMLRLF